MSSFQAGENVVWRPQQYIFDMHRSGDIHTSNSRAEGKETRNAEYTPKSVSSIRVATPFGLLVGEMDEFIDHYQRASKKASTRINSASSADENTRTTWQIPSRSAEQQKGSAKNKTGQSWFGALQQGFQSSKDWQEERKALLTRISRLEAQLTEAGIQPSE